MVLFKVLIILDCLSIFWLEDNCSLMLINWFAFESVAWPECGREERKIAFILCVGVHFIHIFFSSHAHCSLFCCSVVKSCLTLCNPTDYNIPGSSVLRCLLEFPQIHIRWISDCSLTISSFANSSFCLQSFPTAESFPMVFASCGQMSASPLIPFRKTSKFLTNLPDF